MHSRGKGAIKLLLALGLIAVTWLVVLPWLGERPGLRERIAREERQGIDPSAMFYTELDAMSAIEERVRLPLCAAEGKATEPTTEQRRESH